MKKIKILFFTPYGGYTGSEMMLWYLLSCLDKNKFEVKLFSGTNGSLLKAFPKDVEVEFSRSNSTLWNRIIDKVLKKLNLKGIEERQILRLHNRFKPNCWYINTMTMSNVTHLAIKQNVKFIVHFHELLMQYASVSSEDLKKVIENAYYTVGCSEKVCKNLKTLGAAKIHKQYECVDFSRIELNAFFSQQTKLKHHISEDKFLIVMSGQRIERKGFDIFVETAIRLKQENYHFLWLGTSKNSGYELFLEKRIKSEALNNITILTPSNEDYYNYLNMANLFFLTSREDPFPLVMIEAAYLGVPILAFNSGGSKEFVVPEVGNIIEEITTELIDVEIAKMKVNILANKYHKKVISDHAKKYSVENQTQLFENWFLQNGVN